MKLLLFILVSVYLAVTVMSISEAQQKLKDGRKKAVQECRKELTNVSEDDFGVVKSPDEPKNEAQHCVIECVYEKFGMLKNGKLNADAIANAMQIMVGNQTIFAMVEPMFRACQSEVEKSYNTIRKCGVAWAFHSCMGKKKQEAAKGKH